MKIGFLIIASEVLDGKITDANTKHLADFLKTYELEIQDAMFARDTKDSIEHALHTLFQRNDVVITSGGLGPTKDDITKETLAHFLGRKILFNEEAKKIAEENYNRMGRTFPGNEHGYCFLPEGFVALSNSTGFAPCFYTTFEDKFLISGPGVPREFKSLLKDHFAEILKAKIDSHGFYENVIARTKYIPEEKIFSDVDPDLWNKLEQYGSVSSLPNLMGVDVGVKVRAMSQNELKKKVAEVMSIFHSSPLMKNIWHFGAESIEQKIVRVATEKNLCFGFAESATGGLCSHRITNVSGSSKCFMGSIVSYDERIKQSALDVASETLKIKTAVSPEVAKEMAKGLVQKFHLDIAISVTGYAGPAGDKVGLCYVGRATKNEVSVTENIPLKGEREVVKQRFSQAVLYALLEEVEKFA